MFDVVGEVRGRDADVAHQSGCMGSLEEDIPQHTLSSTSPFLQVALMCP